MTIIELQKLGARLISLALEYQQAANESGIGGAVIWLQDTKERLIIITRSEYREHLMRGIENVGPTFHFGAAPEKGDPS